MAERIGVLLIHGVGEQRKFEHLEGTARDLIRAIEADIAARNDGHRVVVEVRTTGDGARLAEEETWRGGRAATVTVAICAEEGVETEIELREVWWADLDEPATLGNTLRFWCWGFSMWARKAYEQAREHGERGARPLSGAAFMFPPGKGRRRPPLWKVQTRFHLFAAGVFFAALLGTLLVVSWLLRKIRFYSIAPADLLEQYFADVKLYQQPCRRDLLPLADMGRPPRVMIRRRAVRAIADMALVGYDRWYVLAHSLGSVIAFNALMETGHALPNYLDETRWRDCVAAELGGPKRAHDRVGDVATMMPTRPGFLGARDVLYRDKLFARLGGLLTYGSPLDKFATLFPAIVPLNRDERVFPSSCQWVNVHAPTDPVGAKLDDFDPLPGGGGSPAIAGSIALAPANHAFQAHWLWLYSHIRYLSFDARRPGRLVDLTAQWILRGGTFPRIVAGKDGWLKKHAYCGWALFRIIQAVAFALVGCLLLGGIVGPAVRALFAAAAAVVGALGLPVASGVYASIVDWIFAPGRLGPVLCILKHLAALFWWCPTCGWWVARGLAYGALAVVVVVGLGAGRFLLRRLGMRKT
jgi:hypothetical protein